MFRKDPMTRWAGVVAVTIALVASGCATTHPMMPTPAIYAGKDAKPLFPAPLPPSTPPTIDLLFVTDRAHATNDEGPPYTAERDRQMAFGSTIVQFGNNVGWDELVKE